MLTDPFALSILRTMLRLGHFAGLVFGLGFALFIDFFVQRKAPDGLTRQDLDLVVWASRFVSLGLLLLWISGLGFLALYAVSDPAKLANPKIFAKIVIVAILTANGALIHARVLPALRRLQGAPLFAAARPRTLRLFALCAAVSTISWITPVILGAAPQLNFVVPMAVILLAYAGAVFAAFVVGLILLSSASRSDADDEREPLGAASN
ncbi:hypothetical protein [Rhizobium sp. FKL33]|uniref:hypothetical protein n=1 Tax=Rhizobium sp. FKL33 TaxID=2562307 RepID=UPI00197E471F|nr:hypothetical protein [Rhizobium sp. FKL33]